MPTNTKQYQREYMKRYRAMLKEAKQKRLNLYGKEETECEKFRRTVTDVYEGRLRKTFKMALEWNDHICECDACAVWFANIKSPFTKGVRLWQ